MSESIIELTLLKLPVKFLHKSFFLSDIIESIMNENYPAAILYSNSCKTQLHQIFIDKNLPKSFLQPVNKAIKHVDSCISHLNQLNSASLESVPEIKPEPNNNPENI